MEDLEYIDFTRMFLRHLKINSYMIEAPFQWNDQYDNGLHKKISADYQGFTEMFPLFINRYANERCIIIFTTNMECTYVMTRLPDSHKVFFCGPYSYESITDERSIEICNSNIIPASLYDFMQMYYSSLPYISDENVIDGIMRCLGRKLWGGKDFQIINTRLQGNPNERYEDAYAEPTTEMLKELENRYEIERTLIENISHGDYDASKSFFNSNFKLKQRFPDSVRDLKNQLIIMNTLCRKAAEQGMVHPIYLDDTSRKFAIKIENTSSTSQLSSIKKEIVRKYCALVRSHSLRNYSKPIQETINYINIYMTEDLSLTAIAGRLNLNSSYLSTLFKKEVGTTLTNYVNETRIKHAIYLLNVSPRPIQEISSQCGIQDVNYFTRLFKKIKKMTPSQYRALINK